MYSGASMMRGGSSHGWPVRVARVPAESSQRRVRTAVSTQTELSPLPQSKLWVWTWTIKLGCSPDDELKSALGMGIQPVLRFLCVPAQLSTSLGSHHSYSQALPLCRCKNKVWEHKPVSATVRSCEYMKDSCPQRVFKLCPSSDL